MGFDQEPFTVGPYLWVGDGEEGDEGGGTYGCDLNVLTVEETPRRGLTWDHLVDGEG